MSVRSSRSAAEAAQRHHPRLRAFHESMANAMQAFEKAREWPDLIKCLARVNKVLTKFAHIDHVPMALTVTKRLAQCLYEVLPGGVHLKALETYRVILERIGPQRLVQDLSLYSTGLFPLMAYASSRVRPELVEIYEKYYLPLGKGLLPCLSGFIFALLPGLEEGSGEVYTRTLNLLVNIRQQTSGSRFSLALWRCVLQCSKTRGNAMRFIAATIPPAGAAELGDFLPDQRSIAIEAMVATLHDADVFTQRSMFDLMISHFPLIDSIFTKNELTYLLQATLPVILRRETSVNRRFYSWLLSKGGTDDMPSNEPMEMTDSTLEMIITSLCQIMAVHASSAEEAAYPFNIARTLLERDEIRMSKFLPKVSFLLLDYAYSYDDTSATVSQPVLKSAQLFFNQANLSQVWTALITELDSSLMRTSTGVPTVPAESLPSRLSNKIHAINLIDFALDFLPVHEQDSSGKQNVPTLIDVALRALYKVSWRKEVAEMTRLTSFTLKLLSSRSDVQASLSESENFLSSMILPVPGDFEAVVQKSLSPDHVGQQRIELEEKTIVNAASNLYALKCIMGLFELFHFLLLHAIEEKRKHVIRYSDHVLQFALSSNPQLSCLGFEAWIRIIQHSLKEAQQTECVQLTQQLWHLLDADFGEDIHRRVATLWLQFYEICPNLCEAIAADAMLYRAPNGNSDETDGYERFARLWRFLSPLDRPEGASRCSCNSLSIMLDAIDDQRTPIRLIALEFIRVSSEFIYRIFDPLLLILLCPSTLRICPTMCYANIYDTNVVRHSIWKLQAVFSSVHRQLVASKAAQKVVLNPTIQSLLRRHKRPAGNLPVEQRFSLPDAPTYLDVLCWCAFRFVQGRMQDDAPEKDFHANEDVRLSAVDLLVQLITASALLSSDSSANLLAIAERINSLGAAALDLLSSSVDAKNLNMQISLLRLLRHVVIDSTALQSGSTNTALLDSSNFVSTILYGIQQSHEPNSEQHLLNHWIGFVISILSHLHGSLGSTSFSVLTVLCEHIRKTSYSCDASISVLLYGVREIVHYCLLKRPTPLTLASQLSTVNANAGSNTTVFGFLGGIFSSSVNRNEAEQSSEAKSSKDISSSSSAIQGILPLVVDAILYVWSLLPDKSPRKASVTSALSNDIASSNAIDLIASFLNPLFIECPVLIANALLSSWEAHARQYSNDMTALCEIIEALPAAHPDCILSTLNVISTTLRENASAAPLADGSGANVPKPSDTAILHFLDQYLRNCKTTARLTEYWPKLMQLQKVILSGTSSAVIPPAIWLLSIIHEFVLRTTFQKLDPKSLKDIRDVVQNLYTLASNLFVKGSSETVIGAELPKPDSLFYQKSVGEEDIDDDRPPAPSWLSPSSFTSPLTLRLLALRSISNISADIFSLVCGGSSSDDEERACSMLNVLLPYVFLNIDNRSIDQLDYAAASAALIASFSVKKFKFSLKVFKKDCWNAFQHNDFFDASVDSLMQWRKIMSEIITEDPTLLTEQLMGRSINPQVLMFTSHKTDVLARARQLKRLSFMIHAGRIDEYSRHLPVIIEKLVESLKLEDAAVLHVQVLFCIRILLARVSPENLNQIWPVVLMEIISVLDESYDLDLILEACKFVDLALVLLPSQFHLYQWMFIIDRLALCENESEFEQGPVVAQDFQQPENIDEKSSAEDSDIIKLCSYNSFNCFQPHVRYLGQRLRTDPHFSGATASSDSRRGSESDHSLHSSLSRDSALRRPLLTMRRIMSAAQLRQFHFEVSVHISSQSVTATPPDLEFIDKLLLYDFVSFGDGYRDLLS